MQNRKRISVRLDPKRSTLLLRLCAAHGCDTSEVIRWALDRLVGAGPELRPPRHEEAQGINLPSALAPQQSDTAQVIPTASTVEKGFVAETQPSLPLPPLKLSQNTLDL